MDERKRAFGPWIVAAVIGVPALYVVSFGPACWLSSRIQPSGRTASVIYSPVIYAWEKAPRRAQEIFTHFVEIGLIENRFMIDSGNHHISFE